MAVSDVIDIALASDEGYKNGLLVTAWSIAYHSNRNSVLRFNVLDGGIADETWTLFCEKVGAVRPNSIFRRFYVDQAAFGNFPSWNGGNRLTYARLLLPSLLHDSEYVIYCDADFLWLDDVSKLWELRCPDAVCQSVRDGTPDVIRKEGAWYAGHGINIDMESYFCAGLIFLNLELCRKHGVMEECFSFLNRYPDVQFPDQSALNAVLRNIVLPSGIAGLKLLPEKWQRLSYSVGPNDVSSGCAIHYAGDAPWGRKSWHQSLPDSVMLWFQAYGRIFGCGKWSALMRFYSLGKIVYLRSVFLALTMPLLKSMLYWYLKNIRRASIIDRLKSRNKRLGFSLK